MFVFIDIVFTLAGYLHATLKKKLLSSTTNFLSYIRRLQKGNGPKGVLGWRKSTGYENKPLMSRNKRGSPNTIISGYSILRLSGLWVEQRQSFSAGRRLPLSAVDSRVQTNLKKQREFLAQASEHASLIDLLMCSTDIAILLLVSFGVSLAENKV